jgi:glycosyltransferase involved in cell wall biosynthesis
LIFSTAYFPFVGGAEVAVKEITDRIPDIEFDMITLRFDSRLPKSEKIGNVNVYRIGFTSKAPSMSDLVKLPFKINKLLFPFLGWWKANNLNKKKRYDGIWAMMAAFAGFSALFFKLNHPRTPYLLTLQEGDPISEIKKKVRFVYPLFKKIFTKADKIQVISNYLADWAREMGGSNIEVIPNGVAINKFSCPISQAVKNNLKNDLGIEDNEKILITTSRLVRKNGLEDLVDATKSLVDNGYKVKTIILGDGPLKNELKQRILKYQPEGATLENSQIKKKQVIVLFGNRPQEDISAHLSMADIFIRPSLSEGLGNSFLEAMAIGLPVIATPVGGIPDFLEDEKTGWFCKVKDPKSIVEKVQYILNNPEKTQEVVVRAKRMIEEKYNWEKIAIKMKEIFVNL